MQEQTAICHLSGLEWGCKKQYENAKHSGSDHSQVISVQYFRTAPRLSGGGGEQIGPAVVIWYGARSTRMGTGCNGSPQLAAGM
jgi:hypothetical protein